MRINNDKWKKDFDIVMPMYNLTEYSNNYTKTSASLRILKIWEYCKNIPGVNDNGDINKKRWYCWF